MNTNAPTSGQVGREVRLRAVRAAQACQSVLLAAALLMGCGGRLTAAPPEQFRVWGTAGPDLPPVPEGWTEVREAPEALPPLTPTADEERRGYVLFARDPMVLVAPDSVPARAERVSELKTWATPGEYEPLTFAIHALEDLSGVKVQVGELRSDQGGAIPGEQGEVRVVRCVRVLVDPGAKTYRLEPFLLEKRETFAVPKGRSAQVWLTLKVPEGTPAGDYSGTISVQPAGREATQLKLLLRILPFALPPAPIEMAMFYARPAASDDLLTKELLDQREHGMNTIEPSLSVEIQSRDQSFGDDDVAASKAHCQRLMAAARKAFGGWRFPVSFEVGHQIAYYWDPARAWFAFWPHSQKIDDDFVKALTLVRDLAQAEGWPPLRAYALDEAGAHNLLDEAVYYYGLIKKRMPGMATYTPIGGGLALGYDEIGQLSSVMDFFSTNRFTPEIAQGLLARGKPYGIYNGAGATPAGVRFFFGIYGWKTAAQQIAQWTYSFGEAAFEGNGLRQPDEGYVYHAPDGPLPSLMWEAVRQGVDDYRYTELLWEMIAGARKSGKPAAQAAAVEAEKALRAILAKVPWTYQALEYGDRTPPPHPSTMRKWRLEVARQILALQPHVPDIGKAQSPSAAAVARSPFDFTWATLEPEQVTFGAELLPPSDFETVLKPWRVEAWNGKGSGELDANEHHSGRESARIEVPADSGSQAVTVLVWPTWGEGKLSMALGGGRTYELSAWVKCTGRSTLPSLRISVPADAAKATRTGKDQPSPEGWQRIWVRTELSFRAEPTYLAVWVQGPGTVWVDDLSLREVIPPPLNVRLDQDEYDSADRVGVAVVTVAKLAKPAQVRFSLSPVGGKALGQLTAPFQSQASVASAPLPAGGVLTLLAPTSLSSCRFVFEPSALAPGSYEAKAELFDQQGTASATERASFRRTAD